MQTKMIKINAVTYYFGIVEFVIIKYFLERNGMYPSWYSITSVHVSDKYPSG